MPVVWSIVAPGVPFGPAREEMIGRGTINLDDERYVDVPSRRRRIGGHRTRSRHFWSAVSERWRARRCRTLEPTNHPGHDPQPDRRPGNAIPGRVVS